MILPKTALLAILPFFLTATEAQSTGKTTRYWDCCKASCGWTNKISLASGATPVTSCDINDKPLSNFDAKSTCDKSASNGPAFMCSNQSPWAVSDSLAYGFAAATISGGTEGSWCCGCYELTFTTGPVSGKKMIVQVTNTGGDLGSNQFDIAMPGGGFGLFNGCQTEWGTPSGGWGAQYGGIAARSNCDSFPDRLKAGCYWRFDWFKGADNPAVTFKPVTCPAAITAKSGCVRQGEVPAGAKESPTWTPGSPSSPNTSVAGSPATSATYAAPATLATSVASAIPSPQVGAVAQYGQCGGIGWSGSTVCAQGFTCKKLGDYYSQCLK